MIAAIAAAASARLYALEAENSGLREALRCIRADLEQDLVRDLDAVRDAQREVDAGLVERLFREAQMGKQITARELAELADQVRDGERRMAA